MWPVTYKRETGRRAVSSITEGGGGAGWVGAEASMRACIGRCGLTWTTVGAGNEGLAALSRNNSAVALTPIGAGEDACSRRCARVCKDEKLALQMRSNEAGLSEVCCRKKLASVRRDGPQIRDACRVQPPKLHSPGDQARVAFLGRSGQDSFAGSGLDCRMRATECAGAWSLAIVSAVTPNRSSFVGLSRAKLVAQPTRTSFQRCEKAGQLTTSAEVYFRSSGQRYWRATRLYVTDKRGKGQRNHSGEDYRT